MIPEILRHTPVWVWFVLAGLLVLGSLQARPRQLPRGIVLTFPAVMTALSLYSVTSLRPGIGGFTAWAAGIVAAAVFNGWLLQSPRGIRYDAGAGRFALPGSWLPLALMMAIFATQFAVGVTSAVNPALAAAPSFLWSASALLGFCAGMFLSRAWVTLRATAMR